MSRVKFARLIVRKSCPLGLRRTRQRPFTETCFEKGLAQNAKAEQTPSYLRVFVATNLCESAKSVVKQVQ